jgi:excisionase family DNA binding protein
MNEPLLTTREVAEMLGLSSEAVLRRWRAGDLPGFRLSTKVLRFRESELLAWLETRRQGPVSLDAEPPYATADVIEEGMTASHAG